MGNELVWKNGGVYLDLDHVDGNGGDVGHDDAPEGVGEGEVDIAEHEVDPVFLEFSDADGRLLIIHGLF